MAVREFMALSLVQRQRPIDKPGHPAPLGMVRVPPARRQTQVDGADLS